MGECVEARQITEEEPYQKEEEIDENYLVFLFDMYLFSHNHHHLLYELGWIEIK